MGMHLSTGRAMPGRTIPRERLGLALAAMLAMLAFAVSSAGGNVPGVLADNGVTSFNVTVSAPATAGVATTVTVTALTPRGTVLKTYDGSATVGLSGLANSPGCAGCTPVVLPAGPTYGSGVWNDGVGTYSGVIAVKAQSNAVVTATDSVVGASGSSSPFPVGSATASKLLFSNTSQAFNGQPINTKFGQPIDSVCGPYIPANPSATNPCAPATSAPTKVLAVDGYGNRVAGVSVSITSTPSGVSGGGATATATGADPTAAGYGEASFSNLRITPTGSYVLNAAASSLPTANSQSFAIVSDLAACDNHVCTNNGNNGGDKNTLQRAYGRIQTTGDFFDATNNVLLNTQFVSASGLDGTNDKCGSNATIGQATDIAIQGSGSSVTTKTTMVLVIPKDTLKFDGILNRGTPSFNVCLGASVLPGATPTAWTQKDGTPSVLNGARYWGTTPDCTSALLTSGNPCTGLRSKSAASVQAYLGLNNTDFAKLGIKDADLVLILELGYPWDAKGGAY
jgi:hypothetical protein